jgi:hypothetical protein
MAKPRFCQIPNAETSQNGARHHDRRVDERITQRGDEGLVSRYSRKIGQADEMQAPHPELPIGQGDDDDGGHRQDEQDQQERDRRTGEREGCKRIAWPARRQSVGGCIIRSAR